jgi:hypothetical protein
MSIRMGRKRRRSIELMEVKAMTSKGIEVRSLVSRNL